MSDRTLAEIVAALSHALDLTEGQPVGHAGRTCLLGLRLAHDLGVDTADCSALYYALLLKDSGCSSSAARISSLFGRDDLAIKRDGKLVDWTAPRETLGYIARNVSGSPLARARDTVRIAIELARNDGIVDARCERGARIVHDLGFPPGAADAVRCLDEHWDGKGKPRGLEGTDIPRLARIACLAQTADVFLTAQGRDGARAMVRDRCGSWFDPAVCDAFLAIPERDPLWQELARAHDPSTVADHTPGTTDPPAEDRIDLIAEAFAQVIDAKSSYTFQHSVRVAEFAVAIAGVVGLDRNEIRDLRRAALLHDIGKLGVSTAILDKPGRLTDDEFSRIREHPRHTEEILQRVSLFHEIAPIAAAHHERLDGRGYHRGLAAGQIPLGARILAVADVYEALTADRPYRAGMVSDAALAILRDGAGSAFDPVLVDAMATVVASALSAAA